MEWELIGGWIASLAILAYIDWRSHRQMARDRAASEQSLNAEINALKTRSQQTEMALRSQLAEVNDRLQTSETNGAKLAAEITALNQQCQRLRDRLKESSTQVQTDAIGGGFEQIQTLLTQYPSVRKMVETQPDLPARNLVALLTSLENLVKYWECEPIGKPWEMVAYDPQLHQGDVGDLEVGESVYIRFIGYQKGDRILIPAKVSRTLPSAARGGVGEGERGRGEASV